MTPDSHLTPEAADELAAVLNHLSGRGRAARREARATR